MKRSYGFGFGFGWAVWTAWVLVAAVDVGAAVPFAGEESTWHEGFARFDYLLDEKTLAIKPFRRPDEEQLGIKDPPEGQRRCVVVVPKKSAEGKPWSWQACYWNHEPQTEVELLNAQRMIGFRRERVIQKCFQIPLAIRKPNHLKLRRIATQHMLDLEPIHTRAPQIRS